jgi:hypothetical protein
VTGISVTAHRSERFTQPDVKTALFPAPRPIEPDVDTGLVDPEAQPGADRALHPLERREIMEARGDIPRAAENDAAEAPDDREALLGLHHDEQVVAKPTVAVAA